MSPHDLVFVAIENDGIRARLLLRAGRWLHRLGRWRLPRADVRMVVVSRLADTRLQLEVQPGMVWPIDFVAPSELERVYDWVTSVTERLVGGLPPNGIPTRRQLGRVLLDGALEFYGTALIALLGAVKTLHPSRVIVITESRAFGRALCAEVRLAAPQIHACHVAPPHLPRFVRVGWRPHVASAATRLTVPRADVLFVAFSEPMLSMMLPAAAAVSASSRLRPLIVAWGGRADRAVPQAGVPVAFLPPRPEHRSLTPFLRTASRSTADAADVKSFVDSGGTVPNPVQRLVNLLDGCSALDGLAVDSDALLSAVAPRVVVLGNDRHWTGHAMTAIARRRGIVSVVLQDGLATNAPSWQWMSADIAAVLGDALASQLNARGYGGRVSVVGRADSKGKSSSDAREPCRARLQAPPAAFILLLALQDDQHPDYTHALIQACLATARAHVLIRAHPSDPQQGRLAAACARSSPRITDATAAPLAEALAAADVVVTQYSTVGVEACLAGRLVIAADFSGGAPLLDLAALGIAARASTPAALRGLVAQLAEDTPAGDPAPPTHSMLSAARRLIACPTAIDPVAETAALITSAAGA